MAPIYRLTLPFEFHYNICIYIYVYVYKHYMFLAGPAGLVLLEGTRGHDF